MIHLNGHIPVVVDVETTGNDPYKHDIIQICALILKPNFDIDTDIIPFYLNLLPKRPENIDEQALTVSRLTYAKILQTGVDPWDAADMFDQWFQALFHDVGMRKARLPEKKKLMPVAQNWPYDRQFLAEWLGRKGFEDFFHVYYRDTMTTSLFLNDHYAADPRCALPHKVPFPKSNLAYLCSQLKIPHERGHDALQDCIVTAKVYKSMFTLTF